MRQAIIQWLARELADFVDELIVDWLESGRLADLIADMAPDLRGRLRAALDRIEDGADDGATPEAR